MTERPSVDEALDTIRATVAALGRELVPTRRALGRRLAEDSRATIDVPRFPSSAMDGYAIASRDTLAASPSNPVDMRIAKLVRAGDQAPPMCPMTAVGIATGAPIPAGADTVVIHERAAIVGDALRLSEPVAAMLNVRLAGEDFRAGEVALARDTDLTADAIGALIGCGIDALTVRRRPRLLLFSTGSELAPSCRDLANSAAVVDSNSPMIEALATGLGLQIDILGTAQDTCSSTDAMLDAAIAATDADLVLSTGGVSGGAFDLVRTRLEAGGGRVHFHGVNMRPGKPLLFATLPDGRPYFGLPGNPVAALVAFRFFVMSAIRAMAGLAPESGRPVADSQVGRAGTTLFLRGRARRDGEQLVGVDTGLDQRSHVLSSVLAADTWLRVDPPADGPAIQFAFPKVPPPL
ncbi:molybdopterin molybdotransferase MoeA [Sphingomonas sp. 3P27F8]|uniref:molybdopterin molybdotransferase MoeA n=1 Tax=Sphingomonas sp. 3P27F8 TaxID=2502213 RepID=UPI0010F9D8A5|nr:molybdopterin molybdotransferase MoeA [Sphingomonas sp. 3P27F8]